MRFLSLAEAIQLHGLVLAQTGGSPGIRDLGRLQSALAQPQMTFAGTELYPTLEEKAAAVCFSLVSNHPFVDGNKRVGHAAMETFVVLNGCELEATVDSAQEIMLALASGNLSREKLAHWIGDHMVRR
jgi:death-on-curing protein